MTVKKAGMEGEARTGDLRRLVELLENSGGTDIMAAVTLGWVKSHIGIEAQTVLSYVVRCLLYLTCLSAGH